MEDKKQQKTGKISYIFTRETFGMTILLFSAIVLIMLVTGSTVFSQIGRAVCTFMYGSFGYGAFFVVALLGYLGEWLVFEKKIKIKPVIALVVSACVLSLFLLIHSVMTRGFTLNSYGAYLTECYQSAASGWSGYTFGGAVAGLLVYPVAKIATFVGAYVIFSALLLLCAYFIFLMIRRRLPAKDSKQDVVTEVTEVRSDDSRTAEPAPVAVNDHIYAVADGHEIVDTRGGHQPYSSVPEQPVAVSEPAYTAQPAETDKYSQENLGRKILFENDEFAAESYRRNMIFSEDSYFNHPVSKPGDYLSSFSSSSKPAEAAEGKSYTESYQEDVLSQPAVATPSSYVYGEKPVEEIREDYPQPAPYSAPEEEYAESIHIEESDQEPLVEVVEEYVEPEPVEIVPVEPTRESEVRSESMRFTRPQPIEEQPVSEQPAPVEPERKPESPSSILSSLFGADSMRGERRVEDTREQRGERSRAELFDDDSVDFSADALDTSSRGQSRTAREDGNTGRGLDDSFRSESIESTERTEQSRRTDEPAQREREVGFMPSAERRAPAVPPEPIKRAEKIEDPKPEPQPEPKPKHVWQRYVRPSLDLLDDYPENGNVNTGEIEDNKRIIVETLASFKIGCEVANVTIGPAITRYDVVIEDKLNIKRSLNYKDAIAMELKKDNVNAYLNFAKGALSIEIPNNKQTVVGLKTMLASSQFINSKPESLVFGLGKNVEGEVVCPDITKMPHLLVAGTTGSGKSICLSTLLISLLYKYGPEELRLILVDPKQVEFISFDKLPHLMINEILYDVDKAIKALNWAIKEMERRYTLFKEMTEKGTATKNLEEYNAHLPEGEEKLPKVVIVLDEFGDLMLAAKKDIEGRIIKLAQKARACGIHLILATQRPSVDCITGLIKSNLPTRIGFKVNSFADSSTIFDQGGAEKLLGKGDMYFRSADHPELRRIQGCFVSSHEVQNVTDFVKAHNETYFDQDVSDFINKVEEPEAPASMSGGEMSDDMNDGKMDDTYLKALKYCITANQASVSMIQRRFPVGYIKACKIIDWMEKMNYVTQSEGSKARKLLMTMDEFINTYGEVDD